MTKFLKTNYNRIIAYNKINGEKLGIVFLSGLKSDMTGQKAIALEEWALENNCDVRDYGKKRIADKTETFKEVCDQYLKENPRNLKEDSLRTTRDRLNQITKLLPEGILINQFEGEKGRKLILKYVIEPKINADNPSKYQAKRFRGVLKQIFNYALRYCKIKESG